jgi:hypothetical protein
MLTNRVECGALTLKKFSVTSFQPHRKHPRREHDDPIVPDSEDERISNADSYVETEVDSSPEQDTLAQTRPSRLHQAVRTEVRL